MSVILDSARQRDSSTAVSVFTSLRISESWIQDTPKVSNDLKIMTS